MNILKTFRNDFKALILLLGAAMVLSGASYLFNKAKRKPESTPSATTSSRTGCVRKGGETVTTDELLSLLQLNANVLFLDARPNLFYENGRIPSAESLARGKFAELYPKLRERITKAGRVIVYCSDFSCEDSKRVAEHLRELGHGNISVYPGGWEEWRKRKGAIER